MLFRKPGDVSNVARNILSLIPIHLLLFSFSCSESEPPIHETVLTGRE